MFFSRSTRNLSLVGAFAIDNVAACEDVTGKCGLLVDLRDVLQDLTYTQQQSLWNEFQKAFNKKHPRKKLDTLVKVTWHDTNVDNEKQPILSFVASGCFLASCFYQYPVTKKQLKEMKLLLSELHKQLKKAGGRSRKKLRQDIAKQRQKQLKQEVDVELYTQARKLEKKNDSRKLEKQRLLRSNDSRKLEKKKISTEEVIDVPTVDADGVVVELYTGSAFQTNDGYVRHGPGEVKYYEDKDFVTGANGLLQHRKGDRYMSKKMKSTWSNGALQPDVEVLVWRYDVHGNQTSYVEKVVDNIL